MLMDLADAPGYVNVPVPEHLVIPVMAFIAEKSAPGPSGEIPLAQPASVASVAATAWTEPELRKLWDESGRAIRSVLKLLASNPGQAVSAADVASTRGGGSTPHQVAGMMGAFGRRLKGRHAGKWPFDPKFNGATAGWEYVMSADVAAIVAKF